MCVRRSGESWPDGAMVDTLVGRLLLALCFALVNTVVKLSVL